MRFPWQHGACSGTEGTQRRIHPLFRQHRQAHQRGGRHACGERFHPEGNKGRAAHRTGTERPA